MSILSHLLQHAVYRKAHIVAAVVGTGGEGEELCFAALRGALQGAIGSISCSRGRAIFEWNSARDLASPLVRYSAQ